MSENNKNKGLFLGLAAATALVGAALLYHFVFSEDEEEESKANELQTALQEAGLDEAKKQGGMLEPQYTVKLMNFIAVNARKRRQDERNAALEKRRQCFEAK